jgi:integrase
MSSTYPEPHALLSYRTVADRMVIYDDRNRLDLALTMIYRDRASPASDSSARSIVGALARFRAVAARMGLSWASSPAEIRSVVDELLITRYGVSISGNASHRRTVYIGPQNNASTVAAAISALRTGLDCLHAQGLRPRANPLKNHRLAHGELGCQHRAQRVVDPLRSQRALSPIGYYRLAGNTARLISIAEDDQFALDVRAAGEAAHWPWRDRAIMEVLLAAGPRISEVCGVPVGGWVVEDRVLHIRDKGRGRALVKIAQLSAEAEGALEHYWRIERPRQDPLYPQFLAWAAPRGADYTHAQYLRFLAFCGLDALTEPLFRTARQTPYTSGTWRRVAWRAACRAGGLRARPHHCRHWYVNSQLRQLQAMYGADEPRHISALIAFVRRMGWQHWSTLRHYDHLGIAYTLLEHHARTPTRPTIVHDTLQELQAQLLPPVTR